ncbi:hypothetical protein DV737_g3931, partial [Chaetothyriales sp. CBS 132003]
MGPGALPNRPGATSPSSSGSDPASMTDVFSLTAPDSNQEWKSQEKKEIQAFQRSITPVSPIKRGNSDPFNAWPFRITPQVNDLVKFYRDWIIPSMYHSNSRKAITSKSALRDYADTINELKDEAGAYAFLSRNAFVAAKANPAMRRVAFEYSGKSTALLAKKIKNKKDLQNATTYWHINNLWAAETIDMNMTGALAHGKMVRHLMEEQVSTGKVDFKQLMYVTYTDCQMSATFMIPPLFDVEEWLPRVITPVWNMAASAAEKLFDQPSAEMNQLDPLPTEILTVLILDHLPPSSQICLALTCHHFYILMLSSNKLTKLATLSANLSKRPWKPFPYDTSPDATFNDLMIRLVGFMGPKYRFSDDAMDELA